MRTSEVDNEFLVSVPLPPGTGQNSRANPPRNKFWKWCLRITGETEEVKLKSTSNSTSAKQVHGKYCQNKEDAGAVFECQSGGCGFYIGDQWHHHPQCQMNKSKDGFLEVLLMVCSFLLSFASAGAFYFTQALTIVGSHDDPVLKHSLATLNSTFAASFFSNFLGVFVLLILQSRREYHLYKKFCLIISNTASFLFMVLGYGFVIAFNIQHRAITD
ncbi:hypothetical protein MKW94_004676 [Papaver nudicaule]|uniref:Uncharacterized protein n=1 Tax=Papaver nudicaule TaxID=74823 RepID=A0AA42B2P8_PAPNU|nr:hypothetical protein [Papaver nudicaule]